MEAIVSSDHRERMKGAAPAVEGPVGSRLLGPRPSRDCSVRTATVSLKLPRRLAVVA